MQLTAKGGNMVVDFYPCKTADGGISPNFVLKVVRFRGIETVSKSIITRRDLRHEANSRIHGYGYEVTDFHTQPVEGNIFACAC